MLAYEYSNESPPFKVRRHVTGSSCLNRSSVSAGQKTKDWLGAYKGTRKIYSTDYLAVDSLTYANAAWVETHG